MKFLHICLENELTPTFVNFKLHNIKLRNGSLYTSFEKKLIQEEIKTKSDQKRVFTNKCSLKFSYLQATASWLDFKNFENLIKENNERKIKYVKETHSKKLFKFGLRSARHDSTPDQVIFNFSDKQLTTEEKEALSNGLKYALPPKKIDYHLHFSFSRKLVH